MAITGGDEKNVNLYLSSGIGATNSIIKKQKKKKVVQVKALNYKKAIEEATVVKIDVEGAEYSYDIINNITPKLRAIILEFHPITEINWENEANSIMTQLNKIGFKPLLVPKFRNGWDTNSAWIRE